MKYLFIVPGDYQSFAIIIAKDHDECLNLVKETGLNSSDIEKAVGDIIPIPLSSWATITPKSEVVKTFIT